MSDAARTNAADLWGSDPHDTHWPTDDDPGICVNDHEHWPCDVVRQFDAIAGLFATIDSQAKEIVGLEQWVDDTQSGTWINCVYCGHRYGPDDADHLTSMRDALREHIEQCPKHPASKLKAELEAAEARVARLRDVILRLSLHDGWLATYNASEALKAKQDAMKLLVEVEGE